MRDILAEIVEKKKDIVANAKREMPLDEVKRSLVCGTFAMTHRFRERDWNLIAECKIQSPAKGRLCRRYSVTELARIYEDNGASMLSVHTDPHFLGCNEDFRKVRAEVSLPLLRKDFIIDAYQIYEARMLGADARRGCCAADCTHPDAGDAQALPLHGMEPRHGRTDRSP